MISLTCSSFSRLRVRSESCPDLAGQRRYARPASGGMLDFLIPTTAVSIPKPAVVKPKPAVAKPKPVNNAPPLPASRFLNVPPWHPAAAIRAPGRRGNGAAAPLIEPWTVPES